MTLVYLQFFTDEFVVLPNGHQFKQINHLKFLSQLMDSGLSQGVDEHSFMDSNRSYSAIKINI
ncbi:hypothetical protein VRK_19120 [Vibrio sp. MEBiC08052]|nr:hypothetical protein VRK_19120 [Vibrio sp. MEBiC08052]